MAFRLGSTLFLFVLLARNVSVHDFGLFAKCFGVAAILGFFVDFGFAQSLLRDIAREPSAAVMRISEGISLKLLISALVLTATPIFLTAFPSSANPIGLQVLLASYAILNSFSEFYGVSLRATERYTEESLLQGLFAITLLGLLYALRADINETAVTLVGLKALHVFAMHKLVTKRIGKPHISASLKSLGGTARRGMPYAADAGITNISSNIDVIIVSSTLGLASTGIYQAGQKLTQGMSAFALVFSNVYLPKLSKSCTNAAHLMRMSLQLTFLMLACGGIGAILLAAFPQQLVTAVYGASFSELSNLLPLFACLLLIRYINGAAGVILVARGKQKIRVAANTMSMISLILTALTLIPRIGLRGMVYSLIISSLIICVIYVSTLALGSRRNAT